MVNIEALEARKLEFNQKYSELDKQIKDLQAEQHRIAGAFNFADELINKIKEAHDRKAKDGSKAKNKSRPTNIRD